MIPALICKLHRALTSNAPSVGIWGSGNDRRESMHVNDLATACLHLMGLAALTDWYGTNQMCSHINIGTVVESSIRRLAEMLKAISGFSGYLQFDSNQPEGTPVKRLDVSLLSVKGFTAKVSFETGPEGICSL